MTPPRPHGSAIRNGSVRILALLLVAGGAIVGTVDVVSVAFAEERGAPSSAGIVLSVYAVGSALAGLVFGALDTKVPLPRLLLLGAAGTALTTLPLLLVGNIATLAVAVFFSGIFFAPTMIVVMGMVEKSVPPAQLTEGMTWAITGLSVGVALGAAVSGNMVDAYGPRGGFFVAITMRHRRPAAGPVRPRSADPAAGRPPGGGRSRSRAYWRAGGAASAEAAEVRS